MSRIAAVKLALVALAAGVSSAPAPAGAQVIQQRMPNPRAETWQVALGVRNNFIRSVAFDPFSTTDVLSQLSLSFEHVVLRREGFAFAGGVAGDFGSSDATARGAPSSMRIWRFTAIAEGRYHPWQRAYGFLRVAPGMLRASADVDDASSPGGGQLADSFDVLAVDTSAGAALRLSGAPNPVAAWITAEGGYGWAGSHRLLLVPEASPRDQAKLAPLDLGTIDPRGVFMRLAVVITY